MLLLCSYQFGFSLLYFILERRSFRRKGAGTEAEAVQKRMTSLAEDLLKSRPISDLRVLIDSLHEDGEKKKAELQSMVGSQYHEFIQSADKIHDMHQESQSLLKKLDGFWVKNQELVHHISQLLGRNTDKSATNSQIKYPINSTPGVISLEGK